MDETSRVTSNTFDLSNIFVKDINNQYLPIIEASSQSISSFLDDIKTIFSTNDLNPEQITESLNNLEILTNLIKDSPYLGTILLNYSGFSSKQNLFIILCELFLNANSPEIKTKVNNLLIVLLLSVTCPQNVYNYIFHNLREIFLDSKTTPHNNCSLSTLKNYLSLLNILYGNFETKPALPDSYMYFNGNGRIELDLQNSPLSPNKNVQYNLLKLSYGLVIHMWLYIECDYSLLPELMLLDKDNGIVSKLIYVEYKDSSFEVIITNKNEVKIYSKELNKELGGKFLPIKKWVQFKFIFTPPAIGSKPSLTYYISEKGTNPQSNESKTSVNDSKFKLEYPFHPDKEIKSITLCNNFLGRITNILVYNHQPTGQNQTSNNKIDNKYNEHFYKYQYEIRYKELIQSFNFDITKTLYCLLSPRYADVSSKGEYNYILTNQITFNDGILSSNNPNKFNGIFYINYLFENIKLLGGFNSLLPICEILYKYQSLFIHDKNNANNILITYISMIHSIFKKSTHNSRNAMQTEFFSFLNVMLSHFSNEFFTQDLLTSITSFAKEMSDCQMNSSDYVNLLISPKILQKFKISEQIQLWEKLFQHEKESQLCVLNSLTMEQMCYWLKYYDCVDFSEYCCQKHKDHFIHKNNTDLSISSQVMSVPLMKRINHLMDFINFYFTNGDPHNYDVNLFLSMLTLKISPCLQLAILNTISILFSRKINNQGRKKKIFGNFIDKEFLDILKYVFAVSLYDVKEKVLEVVNVIINNDLIINVEQEEKKLFSFFKENIIMDFFEIQKENDGEKDKDKLNLILEHQNSITNSRNSNNTQKRSTLNRSTLHRKKRSNSNQCNQKHTKEYKEFHQCNVIKNLSKSVEILSRVGKILESIENSQINISNINNSSEGVISQQDISNNKSFEKQNSFGIGNEESINETSTENENVKKKVINKKDISKEKTKSIKIGMKFPKPENQLIKNFNTKITDPAREKLILSLLDSSFSSDKYKLFIKPLSIIPNFSQRQYTILLSLLQDIGMNPHFINTKKYFIHWTFETTLFINLTQSHILPEHKTDVKDKILKAIIKSFKENVSPVLFKLIITNEENFVYYINKFMDYIAYFANIFSGSVVQHILNELLRQFLCQCHNLLNTLNGRISSQDEKNKKEVPKVNHPYTFQEHIFDVILYEYIMNLKQNEIEPKSPFIFEYVSEKPYKKILQAKSKEEWRDYGFFKSLWKRYKEFWDIKILCNNDKSMYNKRKNEVLRFSNSCLNYLAKLTDKSKERDKILKLDEILNKKEISKLNKYYLSNKYMYNLLSMPYIQILSNLFMILLRLKFNDQKKKISWMNKYQFFIVYCILLSYKATDSDIPILELILECQYSFLMNHFMKERNSMGEKNFTIILINITQFVSKLMTNYNYKKITSKIMFPNKIIETAFKCLVEWNCRQDPQHPGVLYCPVEVFQKMESKRDVCQNLYENRLSEIDEIIFGMYNKFKTKFREIDLDEIESKRNKKFICDIIPFYSYIDIATPNKEANIKLTPHYTSLNHYNSQNKIFNNIKEIKKEVLMELETINKLAYVSVKEKKRYKSIKKKLFSWNNTWSDWKVFYDETCYKKIKFKVANYYTANLMKPFILPIIDINYYLPPLSQYDVKYLFQNKTITSYNPDMAIKRGTHKENIDNEDIYNVPIDYDNLFTSQQQVNNSINSYNSNDNNTFIQKQPTFLKYLYTNIFEINEGIKNENAIKEQINSQKRSKLKNQLNNKDNSEILCCIVKQDHHIHCEFQFDTKRIKLTKIPDNNQLLSKFKKEDMWDHEKNACFGSIFSRTPKDAYFDNVVICFSSIHMILKRNYFYETCAMEIFTFDYKSIYIHFNNEREFKAVLSKLTNDMQSHCDFKKIMMPIKSKSGEQVLGYIQYQGDKSKYFYSSLATLTEHWKNWKLSNFEYLMYLNLFANRSYTDLNQYPVMPWIIRNYESKKFDLNNKEQIEKSLRDLNLQMGMMNEDEQSKKRQLSYNENYKTMLSELKERYGYVVEDDEPIGESKSFSQSDIEIEDKIWNYYIDRDKIDIDEIPYYYGSHFSNPIYVNHFMIRLFPYSTTMIEMQGNKFDDPQRLFLSLGNAYHSASTQKCDVRELIPEFFYLPEIFLNINKFNLGYASRIDETTSEEIKYQVNDVRLPPWSHNDPYKLVCMMKEILESEKINICPWIDLIFGAAQHGKKARKCKNLFLPYSYASRIDFSKIEQSKRSTYRRIFELGVTPHPLFTKETQNKMIPKQIREQCTTWYEPSKITHTPHTLKYSSSPVYYSLIEQRKILVVFTDYTFGTIELSNHPFAKTITEQVSNDKIITDDISQYSSKITRFHFYLENNLQSYINHTYAIYNKGKNIIVGGFWDGYMTLYLRQMKAVKQILPLQPQTTTHKNMAASYILVTSDETMVFCGLLNGLLYRFDILPDNSEFKDRWSFTHEIQAHTKEIKFISHCATLRVVATCSDDGYVNIYREKDLKLMNSVYIEDCKLDKVILISSPLPSFVVYSVDKKQFMIYGINKKTPIKIVRTNDIIVSFKIIKDFSFSQFIVYGNDNGEVVIAKMPFLEEIKRQKIFASNEKVRWIDVSEDNKTIYAIGDKGELTILCDKELGNTGGV